MTGLSARVGISLLACAAFIPEAALLSGGSSAAFAQTDAPAAAAGEDETIVITARRHAEDVADVPAAVVAFSGAQLEERNIIQQSDLQLAVPGLTVRQTESSNYINYVIRGQTVDNFSGSPTAVVPYTNEVQFAPGGQSSFFDLESVQVLKGPQGTLFGRNATGGAVLTTTAKPINEATAGIEGALGNFEFWNLRGMLNVPIVDGKVLVRGAFDIVHRDGFQHNLFDGDRPGRIKRAVGRISLTLRPTETIENISVFQVEHAGGTNAASVVYSYNRCGQTDPSGRPLNCSADLLFGPQLDANIGFPGAWAAYLAVHPNANPGGIAAALADQQAGDFWDVDDNADVTHRGRNWFVTNTTIFDINETMQLKNIFGASRSHNQDQAAEEGTPFLILSTHNALLGPPVLGTNSNDELVKTISDELQLQGKALDSKLDYIVGFYFQENRNRYFYPATYTDVTPIIPPSIFSTSISNWKQSNRTLAVYAHASYDITEALTFNAGARYTWERVTSEQLPASRFFGMPELKVKFDKPSWNVGLDYKVAPDLLLYVTHRGSWRTGGINGIAPPILDLPVNGGSLFLPETTKDIEAGAKWSGEVGGRPAHLYVAVYNQWIKNIQRATLLDVFGTPLLFTVNVPSARVWGFEVDTGVRVTDWLQLGVLGAYTDAQYRNNRLTAFGLDYEFGPYADSPKWSGTASATITLPIPERLGTLSLRGDVYAQTRNFFSNTDATRTPGTRLPGYSVTNLSLDWRDVAGREGLSASLFIRNLFNKGYYVGGIPLGDVLGVNGANVGEPRMWGGKLKVGF